MSIWSSPLYYSERVWWLLLYWFCYTINFRTIFFGSCLFLDSYSLWILMMAFLVRTSSFKNTTRFTLSLMKSDSLNLLLVSQPFLLAISYMNLFIFPFMICLLAAQFRHLLNSFILLRSIPWSGSSLRLSHRISMHVPFLEWPWDSSVILEV